MRTHAKFEFTRVCGDDGVCNVRVCVCVRSCAFVYMVMAKDVKGLATTTKSLHQLSYALSTPGHR